MIKKIKKLFEDLREKRKEKYRQKFREDLSDQMKQLKFGGKIQINLSEIIRKTK